MTKATTTRVALNARGVELMREAAADNGVTLRELMESLMHFAISMHKRPGSWEAQSFSLEHYTHPEQHGDKWF